MTRCTLMLALCLAALVSAAIAQEAKFSHPEPTAAARKAAEGMRREATLPPHGPAGRPLPLASHWNTGGIEGTFEPSHQIELLQAGHHILPWMGWPSRDPNSERFRAYYAPLVNFCNELDLPISFRGTQWESILLGKAYRDKPDDQWAGTIMPGGKRINRVSAFGAIEPWKDPADRFLNTAAMKRVQEMYPDPPLVLFVGNNEAPDLRWHQAGMSKRFVEEYGEDADDATKRKATAEGWIERYPVMFKAMREALTSPSWKKNVRFVGYGAFGPEHFARWGGWVRYSLLTDEYISPAPKMWDGGSPSYYTHNWNNNRDHWVWSTQVQSMNWVFMLDETFEMNPDFWFEISTWDGNELGAWMQGVGAETPEELVAKSSRSLSDQQRKALDKKLVRKAKVLKYMMEGQTYPPERALGWVQYGMWLVRPRAVREFRSSTTKLAPVREYWMQTVIAVDRVWENETLEKFWRYGELVANPAREHPYQARVPQRYEEVDRWFLLDTSVDPERPWGMKTNLPVFSLALVLGEAGSRSWLLYAHAPREAKRDVQVTIPGCGDVTVDVPRAGAFWVIDERTKEPQRVNLK